jgi:predicted  nucleic acid-binding Zn-ribbon protein
MGEAEGLEKNVLAAESELKNEKAEVESQKQDAQRRTAADKQELAAALAERQQLAAALSKPVLAAYERQRKRNANGIAIAEVVDGLCTACFLSLRPQHYQDVRRGDEVRYCENCKRIIFYTPPATDVAAQMQP